MKPEVRKQAAHNEVFTSEQTSILEVSNSPDDDLSIARARVEPGVTTALHYLHGVHERYVIASGRGIVEVAGLAPTEVSSGDVVIIPAGVTQRIRNIGDTDLIFYCICTPRFARGCYHEVDHD
ncbi:MAG: hypothetical protein BMS9Abin10_0404 [Gammaproteobacteria bacterium]|nr:MAG: hypothetical protein BMS9Abin10_0404 [Gammaproteobacteria bacterium]